MKLKILFLFSILLLVNCSSNDDDSDSQSGDCNSDIAFLEEGNVWNYNMSVFGLESSTAKLTVGQCNGEGYLIERIFTSISTNESQTSTDLWKQDGDLLLSDAENNNDYFAKIYKRNVTLGETWAHTRTDGTVATHEVIAIDSTIVVPAGSFVCNVFKYSTTSTINETFVSWNDEIGNIKEDGGGFLTLELTSYSN